MRNVIVRAGKEVLNFSVHREKLLTESGKLTEKEAVVRDDNGCILGIVSKYYNLVPHSQVMELVEGQFTDLGFKFSSLDLSMNGARMYARFISDTSYSISTGDEVKIALTVCNSYDTRWKLGFILGAYRLVCSNGLLAPIDRYSFERKHTLNLNLLFIKDAVIQSKDVFINNVIPRWKSWSECVINYEKEFDSMNREEAIDETTLKNVYNLLTSGEGTVWDLYNNFTRYITFEYASRKTPEAVIAKHREVVQYFMKY